MGTAKFRVEGPDGSIFEVEAPDESFGSKVVKGAKSIAKGVARGVVEGGADMLETEQKATNAVAGILNKIPGVNLASPSQVFGETANDARAAIDQLMPRDKNVPSLIAEGVGKLPSVVAQVEMLGGGTRGFGALGAIQGSDQGIQGAAIGGAQGLALGKLLSMANKMNVIPRTAAGGILFGGASGLAGNDSDQVIADTALGAGLTGIRPGAIREFKEAVTSVPKLARDTAETFNTARTRVERTVRQLSRDPRIPVMDKISREVQAKNEELAGVSTQFGQKGKAAQNALQERATQIEDVIQKRIGETRDTAAKREDEITASIDKARNEINSKVNSLDKELINESDIAAQSAQSKITSFFRENSNKYGERYDRVADIVDRSNTPLTRGEASSILERAISRSKEEAEIDSGIVLNKIKRLNQKYGLEKESVDTYGQKVIEILDPAEPIPFKEFRADIKSITDSMKVYKGNSRFSPEEIPGAILQAEAGEFLASKSPKFAELQAEYRPVISYMNRASAILKPYKGEAFVDQSTRFIKKVVEGEAIPSEERLLSFIQEGTKSFGKGVGDISSKARQIADNIKVMKQNLGALKAEESGRIAEVAEMASRKISQLSRMKDFTETALNNEISKVQARLLQEKAMAEMGIAKRIEQLKGRKDKIQLLEAKRQKMVNIYKASANAIGIIGGAAYLGSQIFKGGANLIENIAD